MQRPALSSDVRALTYEGEGAVLLSDGDDRVLHGTLYERLVPLLDGRHTIDAIVARLENGYDPAEVLFAIMQLEAAGCVVEANQVPARRAEFHGVVETSVAGLAVAITDSYLRPELAEINARQLRAGEPWVLARVGPATWLGPLMRPGETACWQCLEQRLRRNLPFEYDRVRRRPASPASLELRRAELLATLERELPQLRGILLTIGADGSRVSARVPRRPQCPACGDPGLYARDADRPPVLASQPKRWTADGGHRAVPPYETVRRFQEHVDRLTGAVRDVRVHGEAAPGLAPLYTAHYGADPAVGAATQLGHGLKLASGKGMSPQQALASALGEALERYSSLFQGDEPRVRASRSELGAAAIDPNACMQYSESQFAARAARNAEASRWDWIPPRLDPSAAIEWSPVWSLRTRERRLLPTMLLYGGYPAVGEELVCPFDPNGNAAGNTLEEAILQGLLELVERDSLSIWWYNRIPRPALDIPAARLPSCHEVIRHYASLGRDVWLLDITGDLGIPAFAAVSRRVDGRSEAPLLGFGAHLDARLAVSRALTEMHQIHGHVHQAALAGQALEPSLAKWLAEGSLAAQPWLAPSDAAPTQLDQFPAAASDDLAEDVRRCVERLAHRGLDAYVLDQTRPDVGVPVVKVVVPGLRHLRSRFAPGRLYAVPVAMGWLDAPRAEDDLNPVTFFL